MVKNLAAEPTDPTPLYQQLARNLRGHISDGSLKEGSSLPSERMLTEMTGMSRITVRKGIDELIREGLLFRKQGSGTFVARRIVAPVSELTGFSDDARSRGDDPAVIWMIKTYASPTEEEASALKIATSSEVVRLGRVRLSGGEPLAIEHAVVPAVFLPDLDKLTDSLYAALKANGVPPTVGTQRIRAALATPTEAAILCIEEKAEILRIQRLSEAANGKMLEFTRSAYRGDRYDFVSKLFPNETGQLSSILDSFSD